MNELPQLLRDEGLGVEVDETTEVSCMQTIL